MQVEAQSDQRQKNADQANRHVKQASLNLEDIKGIVFAVLDLEVLRNWNVPSTGLAVLVGGSLTT